LACDKQDFISNFLDRNMPDILFIQETWLLNATMGKLNEVHKDYIGNGVSGVPYGELLIGRPRGGVGISWRRTLSDSVKFCQIPNTDRACALTVKIGSEQIMCVNLYLPVDNQSKTRIDHELLCTFDAIDIFINQNDFRNVILAGDLNVDFSRQNSHDVFVKNYARINDFVCSVDLSNAEKGYTYHDPYNGSFSCIDHFLVNSGLSDCVVYIMRCDYHDNPSKHLPLMMELKLRDELVRNVCNSSDGVTNGTPIAWYKVTDNDQLLYNQKQDNYLSHMKCYEVAECCNVMCADMKHKVQIDEWFQEMVNCCLLSDVHLPRVSKRKINKPYWKTEVKPYKDESLWWHNFWRQCGEPKQGVVYENKTEAKKQYMYAVRRHKRKEDQMRKERMAEAISSNATRDFYKEIKKLKPKRTCAPSIDGLVSNSDITEHLAEKYKTLYNSVPSDSAKLTEIRGNIMKDCGNFSEGDRVVCCQDIDKALSQLKADKSDGSTRLMSTHLLISSELYKKYLARLITAMITHGYQPQDLLLATITSIPKDNRGSLCDSSNYRGITLCSSVSKILDIIILNRYGYLLDTSDMQFAYKNGHSTSMCSLMVKETVNYYMTNDSNVYSCCVDLSKAFDRVQHDMLFKLLIDRKVPALILRIILDMYEHQLMRTVWNGSYSNSFETINGV
jgi:exonuclease III